MHSALKNCQLFSEIPSNELPELLNHIQAETTIYEKGTLIFSLNNNPLKTMILLEGSVAICNDSSLGKRNIVAIFDQPGEVFGEVFVFLNKQNYENYAQAMTKVKILSISKDVFLLPHPSQSSIQHSKMISNMMNILAKKAYFLNQRLQIISYVTLRQKIAKALMINVSSNRIVNLPMNREEFADFLNTTRPSLSRELMHMQQDGLIKIDKNQIMLLNIVQLESIL